MENPQNWRDGALVEQKDQQQKGKNNKPNTAGIGVSRDSDLDGGVTAAKRNGFDPAFTSYDALRTKDWLYVNYTHSQRTPELETLSQDKNQHNNVHAEHPKKVQKSTAD